MKKNLLFMMVAAAIFAGCSNSEIVDEKEVDNNPIGYSDVPVEFGSASSVVVSRAVVDTWNHNKASVWGLEKNTSWSTAAGHLFAKTTPATINIAPNGLVTFDGEGKKYYYPMSSSVNYSFYACHPANKAATVSSTSITANYTIDGKTDIMWAKTVATPTVEGGYDGYNARYFRNGGAAPSLQFQHCLTRLDFKAIAGSINNSGAGSSTVKPVAVKSIKIVGVPTSATLTVAGGGANEGKLSTAGSGELFIYNGDTALGSIDGFNNLIQLGTELSPSSLGSVLFAATAATEYTIYITLVGVNVEGGKIVSVIDDSEQTSKVVIENVDALSAGTRYDVRLTIYPLQEVVFGTAGIKEWEKGPSYEVEVN